MALEQIEALLGQTIGVDAATVGPAFIRRAVSARMACHGVRRTDDYWRLLREDQQETQDLIDAVVVPETWFFRGKEAFDALVHLAISEWLPAHPAAPLRALSVPCSTGEEPYSMVMALLDAGLPAERLHIDAVDVSAKSLALALHAEYGAHSFRSSDLGFRDRHFRQASGRYALAKRIRRPVHFRQGNLVDPDLLSGEEPYDIVFCRNVLIYFDVQSQCRALLLLQRLLKPDGVLFVGPAEAVLAMGHGFTPVRRSGAFAYRKLTAERRDPGTTPLRRQAKAAPARQAPSARTPATRTRRAGAPAARAAVQPVRDLQPNADLETARQLADTGRLHEARAICEAYLGTDGLSAPAYYLLGLVEDALGNSRRAAECYRKAIYLDPDHAESLSHLALLSETEGDRQSAKRLLARAEQVRRRSTSTGAGIRMAIYDIQPGSTAPSEILSAMGAAPLLDRDLPPDYVREWTARIAAEEATEETGAVPVLVFRIQAEWLALPTQVVLEVAPRRAFHRIPHRADSIVSGLVTVWGELVLYASLSALLGIEPAQRSASAKPRAIPERMLLVAAEGGRVALEVDEVAGLDRYHPTELEEIPATLARASTAYSVGLLRRQDHTIACLDAELLFYSLSKGMS